MQTIDTSERLPTCLQARSLLTAHEDFTTLLFKSPCEIQRPGFVFSTLKKHLPDATVEEVKRMSLTADNCGAVFDVPSKLVKVGCPRQPPPSLQLAAESAQRRPAQARLGHTPAAAPPQSWQGQELCHALSRSAAVDYGHIRNSQVHPHAGICGCYEGPSRGCH